MLVSYLKISFGLQYYRKKWKYRSIELISSSDFKKQWKVLSVRYTHISVNCRVCCPCSSVPVAYWSHRLVWASRKAVLQHIRQFPGPQSCQKLFPLHFHTSRGIFSCLAGLYPVEGVGKYWEAILLVFCMCDNNLGSLKMEVEHWKVFYW